MLINFFGTVISTLLIVVGIIMVPMPLPLGALMIVTGVALAVTVNPRARRWLADYRHRNPRLQSLVSRVTSRLPVKLRRSLEDSDPDRPE